MKRIALLVLAALWLAGPSPTFAQTPVKICFPTAVGSSGKTSCQEVTATNPLPSTATISGISALQVTVTNSSSNPAVVTCINCSTATFSGSALQVTVTNTAANPVIVSGVGTAAGATIAGVNGSPVLGSVVSSAPAYTNGQFNWPTIDLTGNLRTVVGGLATAGGASTLTMANLLTTANQIKSSAGQLLKVYCYNPNASVAYLQVFNLTPSSITAGTTKPVQFYGIPATNAAGFAMSPVGDQYSLAISALATTTASGGTPPSTGLDCSVSYN